MPTYNSLGISASLLVGELDPTLSDEIVFRMGTSLQQDTKRIQDRLSNGRALREQPAGSKNSKVGVFQFLGEDEDMVLLAVVASDGRGNGDGIVKSNDFVQGERPEKTNAVPTPTNDASPTRPTPMQNSTSRRRSKRSASSQHNDQNGVKRRKESTESNAIPSAQIAAPTAEPSETRTQPKNESNHPTDELALCLTVDCANFHQKDKQDVPLLIGKDMKIEVFINGQLSEVDYQSSRSYKRSEETQYSGTRFHRQVR